LNPLRQKIEQEIREHGPIPFSRYMELCLYDPGHGYYSRNAEQFGKAGDFYTSSDVHAVFGRLMSRQFEEMWRVLGSPNQIAIVEPGPGRGLFAQDVLAWSEKKFPDFFPALQYILIESSPALRHRMEATLAKHLESGKARLYSPQTSRSSGVILSAAALQAEGRISRQSAAVSGSALNPSQLNTQSREVTQPFMVADRFEMKWALAPEVPTILSANEFFDALPVEILSPQGSLRIDIRDNKFIETWVPASPQELEYLDHHSIHPEPGERLEAPLIAQQYMHRIADSITRGFLITIDYGYTREEQLAGRHRGTVKAIRQHSISNNPYEAPGEQDITADVNFTALTAAAEEQGMQTQKLLTQSQFLMGIGEPNQFADAFEDCRLPQEHAKVALQLKHLVTPAGMGESFHVLVASKGVEKEKVGALTGLSFGRKM
jgi:SAM-dependent MidA family methyltransferase